LPDPGAVGPTTGAYAFDAHTALLQPPVNRQSLRAVIRQMSPRGTASLIHRAVLLHDRPETARDKTTILIADDNEHGVRAICDYLNARGYRVVRAYNGAEAVERARETLPGVSLMDVQMPGMDGLEAIRRIRADARISATPVIAFTALAMPGDRLRCLNAGANDYLSKPLSLKHLVQMIDMQLQAQAREATLSTEE
jgi:CheY-like chemotaxis protein